MEPVIQVQGLTKYFRSKAAVDHLDLTVPRGAIFALLGENGAGKSTTLRMLTGLLPADRGRASILGQDCWKEAAALRLKVGYVPEKPRFYDWMTAHEIGWFTAGFYGGDYLDRYQELLRQFQLDPKTVLRTLSKGQYAKVGLALALALDPEVLILDEPTSGLDPLVRREFLASMVDLAGEGRTILISSHQIAEVERVASHVAFIAHGKLVLAAPLEELRKRVLRYRLQFEAQPPDPTALGKVLQRNGSGRHWQAVIQDPDPLAVETLRQAPGISQLEEAPLPLEEVYFALMYRREEDA
jgi:ABC-2 type transport system ATP-binding protein